MGKDERLFSLQEEVDQLLVQADQNRKSNRNKSLLYKIASVAFAATITVLLGLKVEGASADIFRNVALGLGATITVLNTAETFFDYRSLWVRDAMLMTKLETLKRDMNFYALDPKQSTDHEKILDEFRHRLNQTLEDHVQNWASMRQGQRSEKQGAQRS